ncbi:MAG: nickel-dependent lactate racemase family protein [Anaerolineae bacterium]
MTPTVTRIEIPYGSDRIAFEVPAANLLGVFAPRKLPIVRGVAEETARALVEPIGGPSLVELARGKRRVLIIADDNTRPTPTDVILPVMLNALNTAGVPDEAIEVLIALGTHRPMTEDEIGIKFGAEVVRRVRVINHDAFDPAVLADVGETPSGVPVQVNRKLVEADLVLGVGSIFPHHNPGFSGGAKIIQPGVCGERTTGDVHMLAVRREHTLLGVMENEVRAEMEAIADRAGLRAILNTVLDGEGQVVGAVYGDVKAAFRKGVELSRLVHGVEVPRLADIVIAGSHPCDLEFWQAHKTVYPGAACARQGGTVIVVTPCPEGVAVTHADLTRYAYRSKDEIDDAVRAGEIADPTAASLAMAVANARERVSLRMVSDGLSPADARGLGATWFPSVQAALADALEEYGQEATISVLPCAPETLPLVDGKVR